MTKPGPTGTAFIGVRPATNFFHGVRFAADEQRPLNVGITINWDRLGIADPEAMDKFRDLRRRVRRRWSYLRGSSAPGLGSFDDAGVHENPDGRRNTHWIIRVPQTYQADFRSAVTRFLKKVADTDAVGRALHFQKVERAGTYAKYLAKGIQPEYAEYFHTEATDQGFIEGRGRTFVGRAIGFAARKQAGWKRKRRPSSPPTNSD